MSLWLSYFTPLRLATTRWPLLIYATTWTALLTMTVTLASFSPEMAFVSAILPVSSFSRKCMTSDGYIRVPLDVPGEVVCLPARMFVKSNIDLIVPPVFAAVIVAASACVVRAVGLWVANEAHSLL